MPVREIEDLKAQLVSSLSPVRIYLFGSFADGTNTEQSDFDFYIVVDDTVSDIANATTQAYRAIRQIKRRPVDIVVSSESRFENRKGIPSLENEVYRKGILLYGT
ncbi:MAG: nucleotidyltransferase domain-containing protein [Oscillospiraceae bacterium]|nr:nucleotidyltransferase domain-containing protein [Oscillospiraceae bacterium]